MTITWPVLQTGFFQAIMNKIPEIGVISPLKTDASNLDAVARFGLHCAQVVSWQTSQCRPEIAQTLRRREKRTGPLRDQ